MKLLKLADILAIHILLIEETGGSSGVRDMGRLESAVNSMSQTVFGDEAYPTIFDKSAVLVRSIIGDHPFVDGNKRTAMLAAITLLEINGKHFEVSEGEIENFAVQVAVTKLGIPEIAKWLKDHTT